MKKFFIALALATALSSGTAFAQASPGHVISAVSTNCSNITTGNGALWDFQGINTNAALNYAKFFDIATTPNPATDSAKVIANFPIPASATGNGLAPAFTKGKLYSTGLGVCITGGGADNDVSNATTGVTINFSFGK